MGYQPKHGGGGAVDHLPRLHSPRIAGGGSMTRRANSFKRCPGGEIELQISSPRSPRTDGVGPPTEGPEASSSSAYASGSTAGGGSNLPYHQNQQHLRFRLFKRPGSGGGAGEVVLGLGIRERRKLGNLLFFAFCGVCLFLGVGKIWAGGWFALPGDDLQDLSASFSSDKGHQIDHFGYMGGKESDRMLMTVESSIGEREKAVWLRPLMSGPSQAVKISDNALFQTLIKSKIPARMATFS